MRGRKLISVIVPILNEEQNIALVYTAIKEQFAQLQRYDLEIIFTDNHSDDSSFIKLRELANSDNDVKVVRFARNIGFNRSVMFGYNCARGAAAIQIDADLEDPPSVIPRFLELWDQGHDLVRGVRKNRNDRLLAKVGREIFFFVMKYFDDLPIIKDGGDFQLIDRSILSRLKTVHSQHPFIRGLTLGFATSPAAVEFNRNRRRYGDSKFSILELTKLGLSGVVSQSVAPLRMAIILGLAIALVAFFLSGMYLITAFFFSASWPPGFATTTLLILFGISLNALLLGVIGEYLARIYNQVCNQRPVILESLINIDEDTIEFNL